MKQLSGTDNSFLVSERKNVYNHVASLCIYDVSTAPGGKFATRTSSNTLRSACTSILYFVAAWPRCRLVSIDHIGLSRPMSIWSFMSVTLPSLLPVIGVN